MADVVDTEDLCAKSEFRSLSLDRLADLCDVALVELQRTGDEVDISLVTDERIRRLNRDYRDKDRATDVLSFPLDEGEDATDPDGQEHLGDIVVSLDRAAEQAEAGGWTLEEEVARLIVHGLLHLLGHDHETSEAEAQRMRQAETRIVRALDAAGYSCAHDALD